MMVNFAAWLGLSFVPARRLRMTLSDDTAMSLINDHAGVGATTQAAARKIIDLQTPTFRESPANTLASLSEACQRLGVDAFDVYGDFGSDVERSYLRKFEAEVAHHFGKDDGVFCLSGGMAQSIALAINARINKPHFGCDNEVAEKRGGAFACHPTSHLLLHENNAFRELLGMEAVIINPDSDSINSNRSKEYDPEILKTIGCYGMEPMRLSHVQKYLNAHNAGTSTDIAHTSSRSPTKFSTLIVELPHREVGGKLTPWDEVEEISRLCENNGIQLHCDGARIFEASAGYGHVSVEETVRAFGTVYVSFYKGLGTISGAMLLGNSEFCSEARVWLRRMGGNLYSVLPYAVSSWEGFRKNCLNLDSKIYDPEIFLNRREKLRQVLEVLHADRTISSVVQFDPVVPEVNMVHGYLKVPYDECMAAVEKVESITGIKILSRVRSCSCEKPGNFSEESDTKFGGCRFEWTMGESNFSIEDDQFLLGWKTFAEVLIGEPNESQENACQRNT